MATQPKSAWIEASYHEYVTKWLWNKWGYARCWEHHFPEMLLWYSAAGAAFLTETAADGFVRVVRLNSAEKLPEPRRRTWDGAVTLTDEVCMNRRSNPVEWFTGGCGDLRAAWQRLNDIPYIGPTIASFIMRDLSFLRDYADGQGGVTVSYTSGVDRLWFDRLAVDDQALFIPSDVYVHAAAREQRVSPTAIKYDVRAIQTDAEKHRAVATEIVKWARSAGFDPRDVDVYWYSVGAENIHEDGTPVRCLKWSSE